MKKIAITLLLILVFSNSFAQKNEKEKVGQDFDIAYNKMSKEFKEAIGEAKKAIKSNDTKEAHRFLNKANELKKETKTHPIIQTKEPLHVNDFIKYGNSKGQIKSIKKDDATIIIPRYLLAGNNHIASKNLYR